MAKDVKLLICAREGKRKGEVIDQKPVGHNWGKKECLPTFVHVRVNGVGDDFDFAEMYEASQSVRDADGGLEIDKLYVKKLWLPEATVDEIAGTGVQGVLGVKDFEDRSL